MKTNVTIFKLKYLSATNTKGYRIKVQQYGFTTTYAKNGKDQEEDITLAIKAHLNEFNLRIAIDNETARKEGKLKLIDTAEMKLVKVLRYMDFTDSLQAVACEIGEV